MEIIAGTARGCILNSPDGSDEVRPTSIRARKGFFDSLGDLSGVVFADICAGSGAMGLEAASRGADKVYFFERSARVRDTIKRNIALVKHAGVLSDFEIVSGEIPPFDPENMKKMSAPGIVFADPPYADSMKMLQMLTADPVFTGWTRSAVLFWELPDRDNPGELPPAPWSIDSIRVFGGVRFLVLRQRNA